jgi:hypothetical protein
VAVIEVVAMEVAVIEVVAMEVAVIEVAAIEVALIVEEFNIEAVKLDTPNVELNVAIPDTVRFPFIFAGPNRSNLTDGFVCPIAIFTFVASPIFPLESTKS